MTIYNRLEKLRYLEPKKSVLVIFNEFLRKVDKVLGRDRLLSSPTSLQLECTTKCNLRCLMCDSPIWDRRGMDMSFSDFKRIIDQFPCLVTLNLQGMGEPLLNKDIFEMIAYCKSKKIMVFFTTNATLIDEKIAKKIVDSGLDYLVVSVDGATPETFEKIRAGAKFDQVIENIKRVVAEKKKKKSEKPRIVVHFCASEDNIEELPQVLKLAKEFGAVELEVGNILFWGKDYLREKLSDKKIALNIDRAKKIINETKRDADRLGIDFFWLGNKMNKVFTDRDLRLHADPRLCRQPFRSCFVTVDGYITYCSDIADPRITNFGNILTEDFRDIWNNPDYRDLRRSFLKGKIPKLCRECTKPVSIDS